MLPAIKVQCECKQCTHYRRVYADLICGPPAGNSVHKSYCGQFDFPGVSDQPMCAGGCGTHTDCETCDECDEFSCTTLCTCDKCEHCDELASVGCSCCGECGSSYCDGPCGECECCECECESDDYDCGSGGSGSGYGQTSVAPWIKRGYEPVTVSKVRTQQEVWGVDDSIDLSAAAADFYLLEALSSGVANPGAPVDSYLRMLRAEASALLAEHVARLDKSFTGYLDMIIGGELRHHRASGSLNGRSRGGSWYEWHAIRATDGLPALSDAVDLFMEFGSCSYGGKAWAQIAKVLLARLSGQISPRTFIDRVWDLQHNGGTVFDKISWADTNPLGWTMYELNRWILPAHGQINVPWTILLAVASPAVRDLFAETWRASNRAKVAVGVPAERAPRMRVPVRATSYGPLVDENALYEMIGKGKYQYAS